MPQICGIVPCAVLAVVPGKTSVNSVQVLLGLIFLYF